MRTCRLLRETGASLVALFVLLFGAAMAAPGQTATEAGMQVLTRGPVHEAFAETSMSGATAGLVIAKPPYDPITELPPDRRPEGGNIAWIPGYWSYDDDRSDFIWVSGVWRDVPPGRQWVPGYWAPVQGGSQWISGFWGDVAQAEVTYLPPPPEPLEAGPSSPAPAPGNMWTPGSWIWQQTRYDWQPGYWVVQQPDWVWSPAHYTWTPRGYVYVPGYWDHDLIHRGVMFAPVYYDQPVYRHSGYAYSPSIVIDLGVIAACLFVQPRSHHYYFGDYYDHRYEERGYYPWYARQNTRYGDDPLYMHYRSMQLHQDPDWDIHIEEQFRHRRDNIDARPPQTLALQVNIINNRSAGDRESVFIGKSFAEATQSRTAPLSFTSVDMDARKQFQTRGLEVNKLQFERAKIETSEKASGKSRGVRKDMKPVSMRMPASPVSARAPENVTGAKTMPPMPVAPQPQAVKGRGSREKTQRMDVRTESPRSRKPQEKGRPAVQARPEKTEVQPSATVDKRREAPPKPESLSSGSARQKRGPRPEQLNRESAPAKVNSKSRAPQAVEARPSQKVEAPREIKREQPQVERRPEAKKSTPEAPARETSKSEVRTGAQEKKAQQPKTNIRQQKSRDQAPDTEEKKSSKRGGR